MTEHLDLNLAHWNDRASAHAASPDYAVARYAEDPSYLSATVRFDRELLGSLTGQRGLHLQCHIGTDTVPLTRLGATMTGLDFADRSPAEAAAAHLHPAGGALRLEIDVSWVTARHPST